MTSPDFVSLVHDDDLITPLFLGPLSRLDFDCAELLVHRDQLVHEPGIQRGVFLVMLHLHKDWSEDQWPSLLTGETKLKPEWFERDALTVLRVRTCADLVPGDPRLPAELQPMYRDLKWVQADLLGTYTWEKTSQGMRKPAFFSNPGLMSVAQRYCAFHASARLRELLVNGTVQATQRIRFGTLRYSENAVALIPPTLSYLSMHDIRGKRSAMFGKTRLGKSNTVKLLVQGMLDVTKHKPTVGQLIFDVNGEYANSNPQDGQQAIASAYPDRCKVYYLADQRDRGSDSHLLRFNVYEQTDQVMGSFRELLPDAVSESEYVRHLLNCRLPPAVMPQERDTLRSQFNHRRMRKIMLFWSILQTAGFEYDETRLHLMLARMGSPLGFNPGFAPNLRLAAYQAVMNDMPPRAPANFKEMVDEFICIVRFALRFPNDPSLRTDAAFIFDSDEEVMASFLCPEAGVGPYVLRALVDYHAPQANDFVIETIELLELGQTVIVDLSSANERIIRYFARTLSTAVFNRQEVKFVQNLDRDHFIQIYFEEAHMIFPPNAGNVIDIYSRFAKEGAKFNIGIVYSTQSPSTVNRDLLAQTENFFIGHLSSQIEVDALAVVQYAFKGLEQDIMQSRTPGYMRVLTASHRYPLSLQVNRYDGQSLLMKDSES